MYIPRLRGLSSSIYYCYDSYISLSLCIKSLVLTISHSGYDFPRVRFFLREDVSNYVSS